MFKKFLCISIVSASLFLQSCEKCYECTNNAAKPIDICGKGAELDDAKSLVETAGYSCEAK